MPSCPRGCKTKICAVKVLKVAVLPKKKIVFEFSNETYGTYIIFDYVKRHTHQPHELSAYLFIVEP